MTVTDELDALIEQLDQAIEDNADSGAADSPAVIGEPDSVAHSGKTDALDLILGSAPRRTAVKRLHDSEVVQQFRQDLLNGLVRIERLNQVLKLVGAVINRFLK